jgi:hypothetical protein
MDEEAPEVVSFLGPFLMFWYLGCLPSHGAAMPHGAADKKGNLDLYELQLALGFLIRIGMGSGNGPMPKITSKKFKVSYPNDHISSG